MHVTDDVQGAMHHQADKFLTHGEPTSPRFPRRHVAADVDVPRHGTVGLRQRE